MRFSSFTALFVVLCFCHLLFGLTAVQLEARPSCVFLPLAGLLSVFRQRLGVSVRSLAEELKNT